VKYSAILFDVDGTLLDTGPGLTAAIDYTIKSEGLQPLDDATIRSLIGPPIQDSFRRIYGLSVEEAWRITSVFRSFYQGDALLMAQPYDGIMDVCAELVRRDVSIAIATYKRQDYAERILKHFGFDHFTSHLFGSDFEGKFTKADIIANAAASLGVPHEDALMVGDTKHDAIGAEQAGMPFLGVTYGYGFATEEEVRAYPCVGVVAYPREILKYFPAE
jgi:phosphoglycolate phosphatase